MHHSYSTAVLFLSFNIISLKHLTLLLYPVHRYMLFKCLKIYILIAL